MSDSDKELELLIKIAKETPAPEIDRNDLVALFIHENEIVESDVRIKASHIYWRFLQWFLDTYPSKDEGDCLEYKKFFIGFAKRFKRITNVKWSKYYAVKGRGLPLTQEESEEARKMLFILESKARKLREKKARQKSSKEPRT